MAEGAITENATSEHSCEMNAGKEGCMEMYSSVELDPQFLPDDSLKPTPALRIP